MNILIIGQGSIGKRHASVLTDLGHEVAVVSKHLTEDKKNVFNNLVEALRTHSPEYIVIANETYLHAQSIKTIRDANYHGRILVEKPLAINQLELPENDPQTFVGYNLRFHPGINRLKKHLENKDILSCQIYVGQYLPTWRTQRSYESSYSSSKNQGGGVLWDLSHEIDYLLWLFDDWKKVICQIGKTSNLNIDSDDNFSALLEFEKCPMVSLQLNYLDRIGRREITLITNDESIKVDLVKGTYTCNDKTEEIVCERNTTYTEMHTAFIKNEHADLCSFREGKNVISMIEALYRSKEEQKWISNL